MKRFFFVSLFFIPLFSLCPAQSPEVSRLDTYFQSIMRDFAAPGFSVVVVRGEEVVFSGGYGRERIDRPQPMTAQTNSAIGSLTKSITALAIMQLVEAGKVDLNKPVTHYLPEFRTANPERSAQITVRMLLNNSSGLPGGGTLNWAGAEQPLEAFMESLQSTYLHRIPGRSYLYSNPAFSLAGLIISRVSGLSYPDYLEQQIFRPLGMHHSSTDPADFTRLGTLYGHHPGLEGGIPADRGVESLEMAPAGMLLRSTAEDLGHYLIALLNGGSYRGKQVISAASISKMWTPQVPFPGLSVEKGGDGRDFHYGLGWMISRVEGRQLIHHGGSNATMSSMTMLDPDRNMAASMLINLDYNFVDPHQYALSFTILNNALHVLAGEPITDYGVPQESDPTQNEYTLPAVKQDRYLGTYLFAGRKHAWVYQGSRLEIAPGRNGRLEGQIWRGAEKLRHFALDFVNERQAVSRDIVAPASLHFQLHPNGDINRLFFSDMPFRKLSADFYDQHTLRDFPQAGFRFYFSQNWSFTECGSIFEASRDGIQIRTGKTESGKVIVKAEEILKGHFPGHHLQYSGLVNSESRGRRVWRQQAFETQKGERIFQHLLLQCQEGDRHFFVLLSTKHSDLTKTAQDLLPVVMDTLVFL